MPGDFEDCAYSFLFNICMEADIKLKWDEQGILFEIQQNNDFKPYLRRIVHRSRSKFIESYSDVKFEDDIEGFPRLYLRANHRPVSWLYDAAPIDVFTFAKEIGNKVNHLRMILILLEREEFPSEG